MSEDAQLISNDDADEEEKSFTERSKNELKSVREHMKFYRKQAEITQSQMAQKVGISLSYLQKIENGKCKLPAYVAYKYCNILHISMDEIFSMAGSFKNRSTLAKIRRNLPNLPENVLDAIWALIDAYQNKYQKPEDDED